jgi:uncharacterized protein (TIGR02271 family)
VDPLATAGKIVDLDWNSSLWSSPIRTVAPQPPATRRLWTSQADGIKVLGSLRPGTADDVFIKGDVTMDPNIQQWNIREGTEVFGADGDKVGKIVGFTDRYFVVEKGFFFPSDYYIPVSAISNTDPDGDKIYLSFTKDEALNQGWDTQPLDYSEPYAAGATTAGYVTGERMTTGEETLRVPVHEEELTATKRPVERGEVQVSKDVVAEEQTLNVPVTEERVTVDRRVVDREATPDDVAFEEGTISVPVHGEEVDVQKRARVTEEVEVGKEAVQTTEQVGGTVRKERVRVKDKTDTQVTDTDPRLEGDYASDGPHGTL